MNRRGFLGALAGALTLDPERLIWTPGAKLISIPRPRRGIELISFGEYVRRNMAALRELEKSLVFERLQDFDYLRGDRWPAKAGDTFNVRKPARLIPNNAPNRSRLS